MECWGGSLNSYLHETSEFWVTYCYGAFCILFVLVPTYIPCFAAVSFTDFILGVTFEFCAFIKKNTVRKTCPVAFKFYTFALFIPLSPMLHSKWVPGFFFVFRFTTAWIFSLLPRTFLWGEGEFYLFHQYSWVISCETFFDLGSERKKYFRFFSNSLGCWCNRFHWKIGLDHWSHRPDSPKQKKKEESK